MLIFSRKVGQEVVVPQLNMVFRILEIRGNHVRVGISAPSSLQLYRNEVWERIQEHSPALTPTESAEPPFPSGGKHDG